MWVSRLWTWLGKSVSVRTGDQRRHRLLSAASPGRRQESLHLECAYWCLAGTRALRKIVGSLLKLDTGTEDISWKRVSDLSSAPLSAGHSAARLLLLQEHEEDHSVSHERVPNSAPWTSHSLQRTGQTQGHASFFSAAAPRVLCKPAEMKHVPAR